jgi:ribonuclease HI
LSDATPSPAAVELPLVAIYADESCLGNGREGDNPGGAAGVVEYMNPATDRLTRWDYWIAEPATTNNRMALRSAIEAFRVIGRKGGRFRVLFTSDSQYLVKGMTEWVHGWAQRGWRRREGAIENLPLWQELVEAASPHRVEWQWVRGHAGHPQNEYANDLAVAAAKSQTSSDGARTSEFDSWLEAQRAKRRVTVEPAPFPIGRPFTPARALPRGSVTHRSHTPS